MTAPATDHVLAERRSLAYHDAVATRLASEGEVLERARARVRGWVEHGGVPRFYAGAWAAVLAQPLEQVQRLLRDRGERMTALRQVSPFAGALSPRERWRLWRAARTSE